MARPIKVPNGIVVSIRFPEETWERVKDIAAIETSATGILVTVHELVRNAVTFVYSDNERLRECFRRSREKSSKRRFKKKP